MSTLLTTFPFVILAKAGMTSGGRMTKDGWGKAPLTAFRP